MKLRSGISLVPAAVLLLAASSASLAQLAAPNAMGAPMGYVHLTVRNVDAGKNFFVLMGGKPVQNGPQRLIEFPNMFVMLRKGEPTGGPCRSQYENRGFGGESLWISGEESAGMAAEMAGRGLQKWKRQRARDNC